MTPSFKPSDVLLVVPPLTGTMNHSESEQAAALIVYVCTMKGDTWQPMLFGDVQAAAQAASEATEPTRRERWFRDIMRNPFIRPDVHKLVEEGFAEMLSAEREPIVVQLLPKAFEAIEKRWVVR